MLAHVTTLAVASERCDEVLADIRGRVVPAAHDLGATALLALTSRDAGHILVVAVGEAAAGAELGDLRGLLEHVVGAPPSAHETYEAIALELAAPATVARVSALTGPPGLLEDGMRTAESDLLPWTRELVGFRGIALLLARESGTSLAITLWSTADAMRDIEQRSAQMRRLVPESVRLVSVEELEVSVLETLPGT